MESHMKATGVLLLSLIPILLGEAARRRVIRSGRCREAWITFLEFAAFQIENFSKGQEEIFLAFQHPDLEKCAFLPKLREEVKSAPVGALSRALPFLEEAMDFSSEEGEILNRFAENFGMQSKKAQLTDFEKTISFFKTKEKESKEKRKNDAAVIRAVGLCLGIGLFILLM